MAVLKNGIPVTPLSTQPQYTPGPAVRSAFSQGAFSMSQNTNPKSDNSQAANDPRQGNRGDALIQALENMNRRQLEQSQNQIEALQFLTNQVSLMADRLENVTEQLAAQQKPEPTVTAKTEAKAPDTVAEAVKTGDEQIAATATEAAEPKKPMNKWLKRGLWTGGIAAVAGGVYFVVDRYTDWL